VSLPTHTQRRAGEERTHTHTHTHTQFIAIVKVNAGGIT